MIRDKLNIERFAKVLTPQNKVTHRRDKKGSVFLTTAIR